MKSGNSLEDYLISHPISLTCMLEGRGLHSVIAITFGRGGEVVCWSRAGK